MTLTSAPLYYNGVVYVGSTGGEFGFRGSITAYNAANGNFLWRFFTVPQPGDIGGQTWAAGPLGFSTGGATVWNTPSVDPAQNMIVFTTGNAAPWASRGPGLNLFTSSFVALNATTGQIKWWYQVVHHDIWDYDCPSRRCSSTSRRRNDPQRDRRAVQDRLGVRARPEQRDPADRDPGEEGAADQANTTPGRRSRLRSARPSTASVR